MIPRTYLSTFASNGQQQMRVYFLSSVTGLTRWADYIPVKLTQGGKENSYDNNGFIDVEVVGRSATAVPFKDYVPVYADSSASDAWQVNATGYIPYGYAGFGDAALVLDFTSPAALDPRITFTRASTATYFNSAGVLTTSGFNLLTYSKDLSTNWTKGTGATWVQNAATAPDGTMTALQGNGVAFTIASGTSSSLFQINAPISGNTTYTFSVYVRAQTGTFTGVRLRLNDGTTATLSSTFTVTTEWTRFSLTVTSVAGATVMSALVGTNGFPADLYIWGAQLEAGSAATVYIPTTAATSGAARFDYDPVTLAPKGLLIEESRTNLVTYSEQFDNAAWTKSNATVTADAVVSPDGTADADKLVEDTATNSHFVGRNVTVTASATLIYSVYVKAAERSVFNLRISDGVTGFARKFDVSNGTSSTEDVASTSPATVYGMESVGNGWWRCYVGCTMSSGTTSNIQLRLNNSGDSYTGDGTSGIYIWGAQMEVGAFATSYIPTVASQVTRAADVAVMTGTNFSSWYNATEGSIYAEASWVGLTTARQVVIINNSASASTNFISIQTNPTTATIGRGGVTVGGTAQATMNITNAYTAGVLFKAANAYKQDNFAFTVDGATPATDTSGTLPTVDQMQLGAVSTTTANIWLRKIAYYNRRLTNAELQGITA